MQYRYSLDKSNKKHLCPKCKEKRFVLYVDSTINKPLNECVGRCDKETTCAYHYTPKQYFHDYPQAKEQSNKTNFSDPGLTLPKEKIVSQEVVNFLPFSYVKKTQNRHEANHFINFLLILFSFDKVAKAVSDYHIGTSNRWNGATVFWQIDDKLQVRTGKILLYNYTTGKRIKYTNFPLIDFVHKILIRKEMVQNFALKQCCFGLHLAPSQPNKVVAAIESEKTAVIMSMILPKYLWLSFGGLNNLSQLNTPILKDRKIVVFPDAGTYDKLQPKILALQELGFNVYLSNLLENKATESEKEKGYDLADYAILNQWYKTGTDTIFMQMVDRNVMINVLAYNFNCKQV